MVPAALLHGPSLARLVLVLLAGLAVGLAEFMAKPVECVARGLRGGVGINLQGDADPTVPQDLHRHPRMDVKGGQICRKGKARKPRPRRNTRAASVPGAGEQCSPRSHLKIRIGSRRYSRNRVRP